ncbi:MAG TPA: hypothetical protein VOA87_03300, partial [Thermoanaerobaculia bacterium]|nr:hypothetical protein [Thermoanaerobaculia bacterium]
PPADSARRFGVYAWGFDDSSYPVCPTCPDRLNWAADKVAATGSRTLRVYLGARDPYHVNPLFNPEDGGFLARIVAGSSYPIFAADTAYRRLFSDPRFDTYLLTVYSPADERGDWLLGDYRRDGAPLEKEQIAQLGSLLLDAYPGKTFILLNWEGDNAIRGHADEPAAWDAYVAWIRARTAGVRAARARAPGSPGRIFSALEFNLVQRNGVACGADDALPHRCILDFVGPRVDVDYYSYSAWQTLDVKRTNPAASLKGELKASLGFALDLLRRARPELGPANFLLGEFGFARTAPRYGECRAAAYVEELLRSFAARDAFGVSYAIFWQVLDNSPTQQADWVAYGLFRGADGGLTLPGAAFRAALLGRRTGLPEGCPRINGCLGDSGNSCGAVNPAADWLPRFTPESDLAIFGANFSPAGNVVQVVQNGHRYLLTADAALAWHESRGQINATLPPGLVPGIALVYVTDARGLDSNGQLLDLEP